MKPFRNFRNFRNFGLVALAMSLLFGFFFAIPSASAQYIYSPEDLIQNDPYPLVAEPDTPTLTAEQIINPLAMAVDSNGYIYVSNEYTSSAIVTRLASGPGARSANNAGQVNVFSISSNLDSLTRVATLELPSAAPAGWNGDNFLLPVEPAEADATDDGEPAPTPDPEVNLNPNTEELFAAPANRWKNEFQNVVAIHVDELDAIYIGEQARTIGLYNPTGANSVTIGQNRLVYAAASGSDPADGYTDYASILIPEQYGAIQDITTDADGLIYVATSSNNILTYRRTGNGLELVSTVNTFSATPYSITVATSSQGAYYLYAAVAISERRPGHKGDTIQVYTIGNSGSLSLNANLTEDFYYLGTNCFEEKFVESRTSRGELQVRQGEFSNSRISGVAVDEFGNVYAVDAGTAECNNIVTFAPVQANSIESGYLPASVIGSRPVFLRNSNLPTETRDIDPITVTAIDKNPYLKLGTSTSPRSDIHVDTDNNLIYALQKGGVDSERGIKIVPTGIANMREGWNLVNWGGSDDPDGNGPLTGAETARELATLLSSGDVRAIWSFNSETQDWLTWPDGDLDSLADSDHLFIRMSSGGRYLPYVAQDSEAKDPLFTHAWTFLTYRGTDIAREDIDCTIPAAPEAEAAEAEDGSEANTTVEAAPLPEECSYIPAGTTSDSTTIPLASCLVSSSVLANNGDSLVAVFWWNPASQSWDRAYYPNHPDFNPAGVEVVYDGTNTDEDQTGISFDDTVLVYIDSPSGNTYTGAWRDSC